MPWAFLDVAAIQTIQADLIDMYGGSHGLRDPGLLESAVMRAQNKVNFDPSATPASVAASLSFGLIKNHAFIDGNKRIGLAALNDFLGLNGYVLSVPEEERTELVLKVASSEITEADFAAWVERSILPLT